MLTAYDQQTLSSSQQAAIQAATDRWNNATTDDERRAAHAEAEAIRNGAGYYSDDSGNYSGNLERAVNPVVQSVIPNYNDMLSQAQTIVQENNAQAQANAQAQWDFNREEAQKSRDWQEYMSNTAHQREVQDLIKAGLNPVLSAGGNGAAVTSGSTAQGSQAGVDTSANSLLGNYLTSLINSATAINNANVSAKSAEKVAGMYTGVEKYIADTYPNTGAVLGGFINELVKSLRDGSNSDDLTYDSNGNKRTAAERLGQAINDWQEKVFGVKQNEVKHID